GRLERDEDVMRAHRSRHDLARQSSRLARGARRRYAPVGARLLSVASAEEQHAMQPETLGPFTLGNVIGSGGFGTVYRATHADGRVVALKVLAAHVDREETLQRFEREGTIRIEHPNVVRVIEAGQDDGVSYI